MFLNRFERFCWYCEVVIAKKSLNLWVTPDYVWNNSWWWKDVIPYWDKIEQNCSCLLSAFFVLIELAICVWMFDFNKFWLRMASVGHRHFIMVTLHFAGATPIKDKISLFLNPRLVLHLRSAGFHWRNAGVMLVRPDCCQLFDLTLRLLSNV